ncbi:MAG: hypothetical protein KAS32_11870 [Candidatus Peribacteraceae bacterium]|nr:hypothetical protein [Candidatus Peribacteraceae bacterium]
MVKKWFDVEKFSVKNNLVNRTKAEVIKDAVKLNGDNLVSKTISCAHSGSIKNTAKKHKRKSHLKTGDPLQLHCGYCFPCILRRISMWRAGLEDKDVDYVFNPFGELVVDAETKDFDFLHEAKSATLSLIRFCRFFMRNSDDEIIMEYPQIIECSLYMEGDGIKDIISLHKRFADEVHDYIKEKAPLLLFLFDDKKSDEVENIVKEIASYEKFEEILNNFDVKGWNEHLESEIFDAYNLVRFRVMIALGNNLVTKDELLNFFKTALRSILPRAERDRKFVMLNQNNGREVKKIFKTRCNCPPITGRRTG